VSSFTFEAIDAEIADHREMCGEGALVGMDGAFVGTEGSLFSGCTFVAVVVE
jgi:hypothetical protein